MRILRVAQKLYPAVKGGGAYHVYAMSRDQAAMGHDVTVVTLKTNPEQPRFEKRDGYTIYRYPTTVQPLGNNISLGVANHLRKAEGYDVVHAHSHLYFSTNLAALNHQFNDIPLAITNHGLYSQNAPEWMFDAYLRTVGRWTFNQADAIFCYTEADRERVREFGVTSPIEVVPNGIDTDRFTPEGPESELIDHDGPVVLFVGRLVEGKRPQLAVEAVKRLREEQPDVKLYICGEGPLQAKLEATAGDGIEFLGHVSYNEMPDVYRGADVLVLPSRAEGLPRTVLEAMASKTPVITSDLPNIREVVTRGGLTVGEDPNAWRDAIQRLLSDRSLAADLATSGHELVTGSHSWSETVRLTTDSLQRVIRS